MKLLLDQGLPRSAAALLRSYGHDAVHCGEIGLATASDERILAHAGAEDRIVVTLDADFHALLFAGQSLKPSVVRIRIEGLRAPQLATLLDRVLTDCEEDVIAGAVVSIEPGRARVRRLPLP